MPAATPVPLIGTVSGELGALLTIVTVPEKLPEELGANTTLNEELLPAPTEIPEVLPLTLKPVPETVTDVIDRLEVPVLSRVIV